MDGDELNLKNMDIEIILQRPDSKKKNVLVVKPKGEKAWIYELEIKEVNPTIVVDRELKIKAKVIDAYPYMIGKI